MIELVNPQDFAATMSVTNIPKHAHTWRMQTAGEVQSGTDTLHTVVTKQEETIYTHTIVSPSIHKQAQAILAELQALLCGGILYTHATTENADEIGRQIASDEIQRIQLGGRKTNGLQEQIKADNDQTIHLLGNIDSQDNLKPIHGLLVIQIIGMRLTYLHAFQKFAQLSDLQKSILAGMISVYGNNAPKDFPDTGSRSLNIYQ